MENIIARDNVPEYRGDRDMLTKEIEDFEGIIKSEIEKERNLA
jgi:hypothetical protein